MAIEAVLCDITDVILFWDTTPIAEAEHDHGLRPGTLARAIYAREVLYPALTGTITSREWLRRTADTLLADGLSEIAVADLLQARRACRFSIDEHVMAWLDDARTRMPVWLLTNQADDFAETMVGTGVVERVDGVVTSADVGVIKPGLEIYRIAADRAGAAPDRCLFIDDQPGHIAAAQQLGMTTILYRSFADLESAPLGWVT